MARSYMNQFTINDSHPLHVPAVLLEKPWIDSSWGNDACPSFINEDLGIRVWVDYDNPDDREIDGFPKYSVEFIDENDDRIPEKGVFTSEDQAELEAWLKKTTGSQNYENSILEAGKLLTQALDNVPDEEAEQHIQAALDEINTLIHRQSSQELHQCYLCEKDIQTTDVVEKIGILKLHGDCLKRFRAFQASGKDVEDVRPYNEMYRDSHDTPVPGRVYLTDQNEQQGLIIESTSYWTDDNPHKKLGAWYLILGNQEYIMDGLEDLELHLCSWAMTEGWNI